MKLKIASEKSVHC